MGCFETGGLGVAVGYGLRRAFDSPRLHALSNDREPVTAQWQANHDIRLPTITVISHMSCPLG